MMHVILGGFSGTGKTTVGRVLALRLRRPFLDCDGAVESLAGKSISRIFAEDGEAFFRALEVQTVQTLVGRDHSVVALGGGTLCTPANLEVVRRAGALVCLTADPLAIYHRVSGQVGQRPLLQTADPLGTIRALLAARASVYAQAEFHLDTTHLTPDQVAGQVLEWVRRCRAATVRLASQGSAIRGPVRALRCIGSDIAVWADGGSSP